MAENESGQEKTEQATEKRLRESREKGQTPRSKDLNSTAIMIFGGFGLMIFGPDLIDQLKEVFKIGLGVSREQIMDPTQLAIYFAQIASIALWAIAPFLTLMLFAALSAPMILGGWVFSQKALVPDFKKLNPISGLKRILSVKGLVELLKALGKSLVVASIATIIFYQISDDLVFLGEKPLLTGLAEAGFYVFGSFIALSLGMVVIAAVDVPFQLMQHNKQLKMSKQEVKQEMRDTEGKPEVKGKIRSLQQQLAQARMMEEVPKADIIITNPTHYSIALRYDQTSMRAPVLLAKGVDLIAMRIREIATENGISIISSPQLARAIYASTDLQKEIPSPLYLAVAQVMAFVYQLKAARREGAPRPKSPKPEIPEDFLEVLRGKGSDV